MAIDPYRVAAPRRLFAIAVFGLATLVVLVTFACHPDHTAAATTPASSAVTGAGGVVGPTTFSPLIGAYYSDWFPANSVQGTLRQHLVPNQGADPTKVHSNSPKVAAQAIAQATKSGISFFALDYWPGRPAQNKNIGAFLRAKNIGNIKFCLLYETWDLGFDAPHESTPVTPAMTAHFDADLLHFANTYFRNPSYLRFQGRPVLVLYLTRTLTGDVSGFIHQARDLLARHGFNPYLIGDEVFWRVTSESSQDGRDLLTQQPQSSRIELFNAITSYSLYDGDPGDPLAPGHDFVGYPGRSSIVSDEVALYRRYMAAGDGVPVIPDVTPGENTRGVRLAVNEPAEPRQWLPGEPSSSTLTNFLTQIADPIISPDLPMVFVTSWNEWNEDTAIQPVGGTPTARDNSPSGTAYTQGYTYGGEGDADLTALRNYVAVAWGHVIDDHGHGLSGVSVSTSVSGHVISRARTDDEGWYVLPRASGTRGKLRISIRGHVAHVIPSPTLAVQVNATI